MSELIGQQLGTYQIIALLGRGGMATVYRAHQASMGRDVAIKVIKPELSETSDFVVRFERETRTIASLSHPHILKVFDSGRQGDRAYLVMDLIKGGSLTDMIQDGIPPIATTSRILDQIASALDYAHSLGIIHRDLKPQNVLLDDQKNAYLTDFGIAKILSATVLTQTGTAMGTPAYMSPEQWQGQTLDSRSDIYALGVMLFEMLTGTLPFNSETPFGLMHMHIYQPPPPLHTIRPDLPLAVEIVLDKALEKDRAVRYATAGELATDFRYALTDTTPAVGSQAPGHSGQTGTAIDLRGQSAPASAQADSTIVKAKPTSATKRSPAIFIAGAAIALSLIIGFVLFSGVLSPAKPPTLTPSAQVIDMAGTQAIESSTGTAVANLSNTQTLDAKTTIVIAEITSTAVAMDTEMAHIAPSPTALTIAPPIVATIAPTNVPTLTPSLTLTVTTSPSVAPTKTLTSTLTPSVTPSTTPTATFSLTPTLIPTMTATLKPTIVDTATLPAPIISTATAIPTATDVPLAMGKIAYGSKRNGKYHLFTVDANGKSAATLLLPSGADDFGASWSNDGQHLAFTSNRTGHNEIFTIAADGSGLTQLTHSGSDNYAPAWSPDGTQIAWHTNRDGNYEIYLMDAATGAHLHRLTTNPGDDANPSWSPDGTQIVFNSKRSATSGIYVMSATNPADVKRLSPDNLDTSDPAWSPDGKLIVFAVFVNKTPHLYLMNADGSNVHPLMDNGPTADQAAWSPNSQFIVFRSHQNNTNQLSIVRIDGVGLRQITNEGEDNEFPTWQPGIG